MIATRLVTKLFSTPLLLALACGSQDAGAPNGGGAADAGASRPDAISADPDAGLADTGAAPDLGVPDSGPADAAPAPDGGAPEGDGNDSFATATLLPWGFDNGIVTDIGTPGDRDYFRIEATEGQWLWLEAAGNPTVDPDLIDTVITLYDADLARIARNDDIFPGGAVDSRLWTRVPATGTYYVEVQDWFDFDGREPRGGPEFTYEIRLRAPDPTNAFVVEDGELGDDAATATEEPDFTGSLLILGTFDHPGDVDVFRVPLQGEANVLTWVAIMPWGDEGLGGTTVPARVATRDATTGRVTSARVPPTQASSLFPPSEEATELEVWVEHPGGPLGANDFYVLLLSLASRSPPEQEDATNGTIATAETLTGWQAGAPGQTQALFALDLPAGDVDVFRGELDGDDEVGIQCGARNLGSALLDLTVELLNGDGAVVATAQEDPIAGLTLAPTRLTGTTFYARFTALERDPTIDASWATCLATVGD